MSRRSDLRALQRKVAGDVLKFVATMKREEVQPSATWSGYAPVDTAYTNFLGITRPRLVLGFCRLHAWNLPGTNVDHSGGSEPVKILEDAALLLPDTRVIVPAVWARDRRLIEAEGYTRVELFDSKMIPEYKLRELSRGFDNWFESV